MAEETVVLFFGDIFARPGRNVVAAEIADLKERYQPDFILGNVENISGGRGINKKGFNEMLQLGFHGFTSGNHIWDNKEALEIFESDTRLIRPANFISPDDYPCPGSGRAFLESNGKKLMVMNLMGRVHMDAVECPFACVSRILREEDDDVPVLVDFHAEATSEKSAMGWHLAGKVSAVLGTHTHVQTADARVLPGGTAYITDVGMTGSFDSIIGVDREIILERFLTKRPVRHRPGTANLGVSGVVIRIRPNKKARSIERIFYSSKAFETE